MTGSYNNFFRVFDRHTKRDVTLEASKEIAKPKTVLKPRKVSNVRNFFLFVSFKINQHLKLDCFYVQMFKVSQFLDIFIKKLAFRMYKIH